MKRGKQQKKRQQATEDTLQVCQVCFMGEAGEKKGPRNQQQYQQRKKLLQLVTCKSCNFKVHRHCYFQGLNQLQPKPSIKCDFCKQPKPKTQKQQCFICQCQGKFLKKIQGQKDKFAHVYCALSSEMVVLESFKGFKFRVNKDYRLKEQKGRDHGKCTFCKVVEKKDSRETSEALFKCYHSECNFYSHIPCLLESKVFLGVEDDVIFNLLNQTLGSFRVKNADFLKKNGHILKAVDMLQKPKRTIPMLTCTSHSLNFKWCTTCFTTQNNNDMSECTRCYRWIHNGCSKMKNKSEGAYFQCDACIYNEIYMQRTLLPEQICKLKKIEDKSSGQKWTDEEVKYLDAFAFRSSEEIHKKIRVLNNVQFQTYQLYSYLQRQYLANFQKDKKPNQPIQKILQKITPTTLKQMHTKKIIQLLYFLKYKQVRNRHELTSPQQIIALKDVYPPLRKKRKDNERSKYKVEQQQNWKKILDKLLDMYISNLKQAEIKDITFKLIDFSDRIRRETNYIKDSCEVGSKKAKKPTQSILQTLRKKPYNLAIQLRQLFKMLSVNKDKLKGKLDIDDTRDQMQSENIEDTTNKPSTRKSKQTPPSKSFLLLLIRTILAFDNQVIQAKDLQDLIQSYRRILYISRISTKKPTRKLTLGQEQYYKITNKVYDTTKTRLNEESQARIAKFFRGLLKDNNIKEHYLLRGELAQKYDLLVAQNRLTYDQHLQLRSNLAEQGLFVDRHSKVLELQKRAVYFRVLKLKYFKTIKAELDEGEHPEFPIRISDKNRKIALDNVRLLLDNNGKAVKLTAEQKSMFEYFMVKEQVFNSILREQLVLGSKLERISCQQQQPHNQNKIMQQQSQQKSSSPGPHPSLGPQTPHPHPPTIPTRLKRIFTYWTTNQLQSPYHILKLLSPITQKNIHFPLQYQTLFNQLIQSLAQRYNMLIGLGSMSSLGQQNYRIKSDQFMKLWRLVEYAGMENSYEKLKVLSEEYNQWLGEIEERFSFIAKVLEDMSLNSQLLEVIDRKIAQAERFQLDLKTQVKKLKLVKLWAMLSQKFQKDVQRKPTISAIQQFKSLMIKINYPHNAIYLNVIQLQKYGNQLNSRIQKYLKKQKQQDLEFHEQLILLNNKMPFKEADALNLQLENSRLDVSAQRQELENQIAVYAMIPPKLDHLLRKENNLDELVKIRGRILDSPIRYEDLEGYCQLVHRIAFLKCQQQDYVISRKEFNRLLNTGDLGVIQLTQRNSSLIKAYRYLDRAQKQSLSPKPKPQNLLPIDSRTLKSLLTNDPTTLKLIQRTYQKVQQLRQKFTTLKSAKAEYEKYILLQYQLSRYLVSYKDISTEIHKMKRQLELLVDRAQMIKKNFNPKEANDIVRNYEQCGMRHHELDRLKKVNEAYGICMALSQRQQDYPEFSHKCNEYTELATVIPLNQIRNQLFQQYAQEVLDSKDDKNQTISLLNALMFEGTHLCHTMGKNSASSRGKMLEKLLKLNSRLAEITKSSSKRKDQNYDNEDVSGDYNEYSDQDQNEDFDDEDDDQNQDYGDDEDEDDDAPYDYDNSDQQSIPQPPRKRPPMVMQISDEDASQPQVRKVAHTGNNAAPPLIQPNHQAQNISSSSKQ